MPRITWIGAMPLQVLKEEFMVSYKLPRACIGDDIDLSGQGPSTRAAWGLFGIRRP